MFIMSGSAKEWLFVALFFAMFFASSIAEMIWLIRKTKIDIRRTLIVVLLPNFLTITLGFLGTFVVFGILLAVAWDENTHMPGGDAATWAVFLLGILFPLFLLVALKAVLIKVMRFATLNAGFKGPFRYSFISSLLFFLSVVGIPAAALFLF
ncbi:MAG: hypothetical protein JNJ39_09775 [Blastocatellia bacterium]|jgi:hypothetical protein|nr:hypothetical protein [Blastocatellia bacterium]